MLMAGVDRSEMVGALAGPVRDWFAAAFPGGPPHLLITTPESLALQLSQPAWHEHWRGVRHLIVDEVHALVPTKRGADLAVSLERLAARAAADPSRIGLSATCRPADPVARFL